MKKYLVPLILVICIFMLLPTVIFGNETLESEEDPLIVAYYNVAAGSISSHEYTHIDVLNYHPGNIALDANNSGESIFNHRSSALSSYRSIALKQNPDIKILFTLATNNLQVFESWFQSEAKAEKLADEVINVIEKYGYDGFDIDYEFPSDSMRCSPVFIHFMKTMRQRLDALGEEKGKVYYLSMAVPGTQWTFSLFDMNALAEYVDYFNMMNYDLYINQEATHHHTPPYDNAQWTGYVGGSVYSDIQLYIERGIPKSKIVAGCGAYSLRWTGVKSDGNGLYTAGTRVDENLHMTNILANYVNKNGWVRYWDDEAKAPYLYNKTKQEFISYDDEESIKIKCEIVAQNDVRGIMVFDYCTADGIGLFDNMYNWLAQAETETPDTENETQPHDHRFPGWYTVIPATNTTHGLRRRDCELCDYYEEEVLPSSVLPYIAVDNFKVSITLADDIKDMRYALGEYSTASEIKAAEGNVALSNSLIAKNTVDGIFHYEMPKGGYYTIWIRMQDGREYFLPLDVTGITPSVSSYGVRITLHNLNDVKDFFIAKGRYNSYSQVKANGYIVSVTSAKIGTKHDYTYTVSEPGAHTVLIRYNDGTQKAFHETLTVDEPVFTENGLQVKISNIPDVKVIRTAYGEWNTTKELKATDTIRNFSNKTVIKNAEEYTIQYREEGMVTILVEYNNGYIKTYHYRVQKKKPTLSYNNAMVIFSDLDGLVVIRYAMGEYTTSSQIKNAPGSQFIKPSQLTNGYAVILGLAKGIYTFSVQYDDESYNYYTIEII